MKKIADIVFIVVFLVIIVACIVFSSTETDRISETEKRKLANPPTSDFFTAEYKSELQAWLSDNIGFRDDFLELRTNVMYKGLNKMTTDDVQKGKDGWFFYTPDYNIEIATGEYPLDEAHLKEIAEAQQAISDHYKEEGREYVLVLTPSKASIYPEYLFGEYSVTTTPIDIVADYLKEHTDVVVINTKDTLLSHKPDGQLFLKEDTHFTQLGAYYCYTAIVNGLNEAGIADITPVEIETTLKSNETERDLASMMGNDSLIPMMDMEFISFDNKAEDVSDGDLCSKLNKYCWDNGMGKGYQTARFENSSSELPSVVVAGDSQFEEERNMPLLLAQYFSAVTYHRLRECNTTIDAMVDPDIVMFTCSERHIYKTLLSKIPGNFRAELPRLETRTAQKVKRYHNMHIDKINGKAPEKQGEFVIDMNAEKFTLVGWSVDLDSGAALSDLYIKIGDNTFRCDYGIKRKGVAEHYGSNDYLYSGFEAEIDMSYFYDEKRHDL